MNDLKDSENNLASKVLLGIIAIAVIFGSYLLFVNSEAAEGKLFGFISFRLPFETTEHFCRKETTHLGIVHDSADDYWDCIIDNGDVDEGLQAWWRKQGLTTSKQAECAAGVTKKYLTDKEVEVVLKGGRIDRIPDIKGMLDDASLCIDP